MTTRSDRSSPAVRRADEADVDQLAVVLAAAFQDDPGFVWCAPDAARRRRYGPRFFALTLTRGYLPKQDVHATSDLRGVAVWAPPGQWASGPTDLLAFLPVLLASTGRHLVRTLRGTAAMEAVHREQSRPHRYLALMAVAPSAQGRGLGTALLDATLGECDVRGQPAYLEATSPRNRDLYLRHGFEVLDERRWPGGGPPWWSMWREPRPAAAGA